MYNCPRAATVVAKTAGKLWATDRATFRGIIVQAKQQQARRHDSFIERKELLDSMTQEQRAKVADALVVETYEDGDVIIKQGDELTPSSKFYIVEIGKVLCYITDSNGRRIQVKEITEGGFFGEKMLVARTARAAECVASGNVAVMAMKYNAFQRLMGPAEEVLKKAIEEYHRVIHAHGDSFQYI